MPSLIHFRSRIEGYHSGVMRSHRGFGQSSEIRGIRPYTIGDEKRDIVWTRSTWIGSLYSRERDVTHHPPIICLSLLSGIYKDIGNDTLGRSKSAFLSELITDIEYSSRNIGFCYKYYDTYTGISIGDHTRSILLIIGDLESEERLRALFPLREKHDIIFLLLLHPMEQSPLGDQIFESRKIHDKYILSREMKIQTIIGILSEHHVQSVICTSSESPALLLNHFFKYRYA